MRHEHDWTNSSRFCHSCGVDGWEVAAGPEAFICHGKPAGNTGRHETPSETGLWDRLRADLNNLGAAYGPIDAVGEPMPLTPFGEALQSLSNGLSQVVRVQLSEADRNAYFDGIILAARKKRESENSWDNIVTVAIDGGPASTFLKRETQRKSLSAAMSRPLDFEPRVGHKGVEIDG